MGVKAGTAVREKGQERVNRILEAAIAILVEEGYAGLSLRKISGSAGIHLGHVQYYFPTKQNLLRAMLERWLEQFRATIDTHRDESKPPLEQLLDIIELSLRDMRTPLGSIMIWEIWALAPRDPFVDEMMTQLYKDLRKEYRRLLRANNPGLSSHRANLVAAALSSLVEGSSLYVGYGKRRERALASLDKEILRTARMMIEASDGD